MEIIYSLTVDDFVAFQKDALKNSKIMRDTKYFYLLFVVIFSLILCWILLLNYSDDGFSFDANFIDVLILFFLIIVFVRFWASDGFSEYGYRDLLKQNGNKSIFTVRKVEFHDTHLFSSVKGREGKADWNVMDKYSITDDYIFIYVASFEAYIIPKYKIEDKEKIKKIEEFVKKKFKEYN